MDGALERASGPLPLWVRAPGGRVATRCDDAGRSLPELFYLRHYASRSRWVGTQGWRTRGTSHDILIGAVAADGTHGHARAPSLCRRLVGGGRLARRTPPRRGRSRWG